MGRGGGQKKGFQRGVVQNNVVGGGGVCISSLQVCSCLVRFSVDNI